FVLRVVLRSAELLLQLERAHAKDKVQVNLGVHTAQNACVWVDCTNPFLDQVERLLVDQVRFVDEEDIAVDHLVVGDLCVVEVFVEVGRVNQSHDTIEMQESLELG